LNRLKVARYVQFNVELLFDVLGNGKAQAQEEQQTIPSSFGPGKDYDYNFMAKDERAATTSLFPAATSISTS